MEIEHTEPLSNRNITYSQDPENVYAYVLFWVTFSSGQLGSACKWKRGGKLKLSHGTIPDQLCYKAVQHRWPSYRLNRSLASDGGRPPALMSP